MPLYQYECGKCMRTVDEYRTIAHRERCPSCRTCHRKMTKIVSRARVAVFNPYRAVGAERGRLIKNSAEHKAYLRYHGYEEVGTDAAYAPPPDDPDYEAEQKKKYDDSFKDLAQSPDL